MREENTLTSKMPAAAIAKESILKDLIAILEDMTADWDTGYEGAIGAETGLVADLAFESIDLVQFIVAIEEHFQQRGLPWEEFFMVDGRYKDEIRIGEAVDFLASHLGERSA